MIRPALILAAHGSRHDPTAESIVRSHAARVARSGLFGQVAVAFHKGMPTFASVLDEIACEDVIVVPFMTSAGYYADRVLPVALDSNANRSHFRLTITPPIGMHAGIRRIVERRAVRLMERLHLLPDRTSLVIVGHGTEKHPDSGASTVALAGALRSARVCAATLAAFLDEPPLIDGIHASVMTANILVIPFLIGGGYHAVRDVPRRLGMAPARNGKFPCASRVGKHLIVCDAAIGQRPELAEIVIDLAEGNQQTAMSQAAFPVPRGCVHE